MLEFADTHPSPVAYIFSEESARYFDLLPSNVGRVVKTAQCQLL